MGKPRIGTVLIHPQIGGIYCHSRSGAGSVFLSNQRLSKGGPSPPPGLCLRAPGLWSLPGLRVSAPEQLRAVLRGGLVCSLCDGRV